MNDYYKDSEARICRRIYCLTIQRLKGPEEKVEIELRGYDLYG